eukprot:6195362-Pleurochrysis_carterae.AAC.1
MIHYARRCCQADAGVSNKLLSRYARAEAQQTSLTVHRKFAPLRDAGTTGVVASNLLNHV